jgi:hypothetical protein
LERHLGAELLVHAHEQCIGHLEHIGCENEAQGGQLLAQQRRSRNSGWVN